MEPLVILHCIETYSLIFISHLWSMNIEQLFQVICINTLVNFMDDILDKS